MTSIPFLQMVVAALAAMVLLMAEHYWMRHCRFHAVVNYLAGCLAIWIPLSIVLVLWQAWMALLALWTIAVSGGLAVLACYLIDHLVASRVRIEAAEQDARTMREHLHGQD